MKTKSFIKGTLIIFLSAWLSFYRLAYADTWLAKANFDDLVSGAALIGQSGGCGWSGAWADNFQGSTFKSDTEPAGGQGGLAAHANLSSRISFVQRNFTSAISNSTVHFQFYNTDTTSGHRFRISFQDNSGNARFGVELNTAAAGGASSVNASDFASFASNLGSYTGSAWNTIDIAFGYTTKKFKVSVNGGAYSGDFTANVDTTIQQMIIGSEDTNTSNFYVDDIGAFAGDNCNPPAPPNFGILILFQ